MVGRRVAIGALGVLLAVGLGGATFWACGGGDTDRDEKVCRSCDLGVDRGCFNECRELCVADDPNGEPRCAAQCDECRRDLVCGACVGNCTSTLLRCAPSNETVECEDGTFGGSFPEPPS
jgi:hypothetical protein